MLAAGLRAYGLRSPARDIRVLLIREHVLFIHSFVLVQSWPRCINLFPQTRLHEWRAGSSKNVAAIYCPVRALYFVHYCHDK